MSRQKKLCHDIVFIVLMSRQKKLCRDIVYIVFLVFMLRQKKLCYDRKKLCRNINAGKSQKRSKMDILACFSSPFHPRTINTRF